MFGISSPLSMNGNGINKICFIQKLGHMVRKSHDREHKASPTTGCALSPRCSKRSSFSYDSDEDCCTSPSDVPEGYLAVYVGRERERFIIPTAYLSRPVFRTLLRKAEEEFGFGHKGGLVIPCEVSLFKHVLRLLQRNDSSEQKLSVDELLKGCGSQSYYSKSFSSSSTSSKSFSPAFRASLQRSFG